MRREPFQQFFWSSGSTLFCIGMWYRESSQSARCEKVSKKKLIMEMHLFPGKILVCGPKLRCWIQTVPPTTFDLCGIFSAKIQSRVFAAIFKFSQYVLHSNIKLSFSPKKKLEFERENSNNTLTHCLKITQYIAF